MFCNLAVPLLKENWYGLAGVYDMTFGMEKTKTFQDYLQEGFEN